MKEYKNAKRLMSENYIGNGHVSVRHQVPPNWPQHWHNYFEFELVLSGSAVHTYNGVEYTLGKGDAYLLTPVDFHAMEVVDNLELINISFDDVCLPPNMLSYLTSPRAEKICTFTQEELDRVVAAAKLLQHECDCDGPCTMQLLEYLLSCFMRKHKKQIGDGIEKEQLQGIKQAISHIELHFREQITLEQLASISGYTPTYFSELFRKVTGQTYKDRLLSLRTSYAKMLLANGFSVSDACFASGFGSLSNFFRAFRKMCNVSPNAYRKNNGK